MNFTKERRKHVRYSLGDGAVAVFGTSPGPISDISVGGLSFLYLENGRPVPEFESVDILDGSQGFFLEKISCRTVGDCLVVNESPYNLLKLVRRSLEFVGITGVQKAQLESYIHKTTHSLVSC